MFRRVLVPLDGSALAEAALGAAVTLARHSHGEVLGVRVPEAAEIFVAQAGITGVLWPDQSVQHSARQAKEYLAGLSRTWAPIPEDDWTLQTRVLAGEPAGAIVDAAATEDVDLICMSTHGYSGLTRWMLGSTTQKVLSAAPCPVLVTRGTEALHNLVITLDGSSLAEQAVQPGVDLAEAMGGSLTLLRVIDDRHHEAEPGSDPHMAAEVYLNGLAEALARPGLAIQTAIAAGPAADAILGYLTNQASHVVAMATHGRTGLRRWVYGSVAEKVLNHAHCALLIVRPETRHLR